MKMSIGVDLHKTQFTVCFLSADRKVKESGIYPTDNSGYESFLSKIDSYWMNVLRFKPLLSPREMRDISETNYFRQESLSR